MEELRNCHIAAEMESLKAKLSQRPAIQESMELLETALKSCISTIFSRSSCLILQRIPEFRLPPLAVCTLKCADGTKEC